LIIEFPADALSEKPLKLVLAKEVMRALIVEDNPKLREFLRSCITDLFTEIFDCNAAEPAFEIYCRYRPEVVLMDIGLEGRSSGIDATRRIVDFDPQAKVIMVTSYDEDDLRQAAKKAGAIGYVLKRDLSGIVETINAL
jgi:DNA-binding NarL/FixJ family response regulator